MIRLSIITVNKNNAPGLEKTIKSVLEQTYPHIEQVIIDGGSNDGSVDAIKSFTDILPDSYQSKSQNSPGISYWISESDRGIYHGMNKGAAKAEGDYLLFLNAGDYLIDQHAVSNLMSHEPDADIVYTNQKRFGTKGERITIFPDKLSLYWLFTEFLPHNCMLIKRDLFNRIGPYAEDYRIVSDWLFYLQAIAKNECTYKHYDMILSVMEDGGISNSPQFTEDVKKERMDVLRREFPLCYGDYLDLYNYKYNSPLKKLKRTVKKLLPIKK